MRSRRLTGKARVWERILLICAPIVGVCGILDVFLYFGKALYIQQYLALIFGLVLAVILLRAPATNNSAEKLPWYDIALSFGGLGVGLYPCIFYPKLIVSVGVASPDKFVLGAIAVVLILEGCRRLFGKPLTIIVILFLLYARFAHVVPGELQGIGIQWDRLVTHLYLDDGALFGIALKICSTLVLSFILFGQVLLDTGGGQLISDAAMSLMGKYRGGPAKVAILASSGFGTMSGSAVGNVATTGIITIPLMKRTGYAPPFAAAVEATASTGGQIMPPIMGACAFLMAEFLGISYTEVAKAAALPAILYYLAMFVQVDLEAAKTNVKGAPREMLPSFKRVVKSGWPLVIPIIVLVYGLFILYLEPEDVGLYAVTATILISFVKKEWRLSFKKFLAVVETTGVAMLEIILVAGAAGLILGVVSITGLGFSFSVALIELSGGNFLLMIVLAAGATIILGMGMTVAASYILVVVLVVPALIELGLIPLAAHMFVFYYAVLSFLTPPVCIAVYAAASIAGAEPMRTSLQAMRLGIAAYLVPLIVVFNPALLLIGSLGEIVLAAVVSALGITLIAIGLEGYAFRILNWAERMLVGIGGLGLLAPFGTVRIAAGVFVLLFIAFEVLAYKGRLTEKLKSNEV